MLTDLINFTPYRGCWLRDFGTDYADFIFDISHPECYPPFLQFAISSELEEAARRLRCGTDSPSLGARSLPDRGVRDDDSAQLRRLKSVVGTVRDALIYQLRLEDVIPPAKESFALVSDIPLTGEKRTRQGFLLFVARAVVFDGFTPELASERFGLTVEQVRILVGVFLTHGPRAFLMAPRATDQNLNRFIARYHHKFRSSYAFTCIKYAILSVNRLRRLLRRT